MAMAVYPEVQKKAQAEIDAVVGSNRLPDFYYRPSLPYVNAVVKLEQSSSWKLVVPLGRPFFIIIRQVATILTSSEAIFHMSTIDDEYNLIQFSVLNFLFKSILHRRKTFNPQEFQPDQCLKDGKLNPDVRDPECATPLQCGQTPHLSILLPQLHCRHRDSNQSRSPVCFNYS